MEHAHGCSEHNKYPMKWVIQFLSTFNFNIRYVHLLQQLQQHISLAQCQYISWELQHKCHLKQSATQAKGFPLNEL